MWSKRVYCTRVTLSVPVSRHVSFPLKMSIVIFHYITVLWKLEVVHLRGHVCKDGR